MSKPKPSYIVLTPEQRAELLPFASVAGWWSIPREELPSAIPPSLRAKFDSAVMVVCGTSVHGTTTLFYNSRRLDMKDRAVDHHPFVVVVNPEGVEKTGMFLNHGDWPERTSYPPKSFWQHVQVSGVSSFFLSTPPSGRTFGSLDTLPEGDRAAFERTVSFLRKEQGQDT